MEQRPRRREGLLGGDDGYRPNGRYSELTSTPVVGQEPIFGEPSVSCYCKDFAHSADLSRGKAALAHEETFAFRPLAPRPSLST